MKPYGIPRVPELDFPDVYDIKKFGFASHIGRLPGKSGDFRPYIRGTNKASTRRIWKRKARAEGKSIIRKELQNS